MNTQCISLTCDFSSFSAQIQLFQYIRDGESLLPGAKIAQRLFESQLNSIKKGIINLSRKRKLDIVSNYYKARDHIIQFYIDHTTLAFKAK